MWVVKPGASSRARGIFCENRLDLIMSAASHPESKQNFVAQKYIERPLTVRDTKFDIRQYFLVTSWNPLTVYMCVVLGCLRLDLLLMLMLMLCVSIAMDVFVCVMCVCVCARARVCVVCVRVRVLADLQQTSEWWRSAGLFVDFGKYFLLLSTLIHALAFCRGRSDAKGTRGAISASRRPSST